MPAIAKQINHDLENEKKAKLRAKPEMIYLKEKVADEN